MAGCVSLSSSKLQMHQHRWLDGDTRFLRAKTVRVCVCVCVCPSFLSSLLDRGPHVLPLLTSGGRVCGCECVCVCPSSSSPLLERALHNRNVLSLRDGECVCVCVSVCVYLYCL